ncbi:YihY family inner membrane protein [Comamonas terrigena]|jgi:membrane protein|nr:membrane protein [Comamonas terrigena NBRC 13299]SUY92394.1 YihY family inner membrane protein [Comamonas terrigena]
MGRMAFDLTLWKHRATRLLRPVQPVIDSVQLWLQADGLRMSAALSFYGMLSLSPLLLLIVALLGWWLDRSVIESELLDQASAVMGNQGASVLKAAMASAQTKKEGLLASALSLVLLASGATGVFAELQNSLRKLWVVGRDVPPEPAKPWWSMATIRLRGLGYVVVLGLMLLVSMVLSTGLKLASDWAGTVLPIAPLGQVMLVVNELVSFAVSVALFWGVMRLGSGPKPPTRYLVFGAMVGAALFSVGKQAFAWYLSTAAVVSAYGAAGSLVVLLMWIYFTSAILLYAAACARAFGATQPPVFGMPRNWQDPLAVAPPATAQPPVPTTPTAPQPAYGGLQH